MNEMPTFLVTGGNGYIGSHVVVSLSQHFKACKILIVDNCRNSSPDVFQALLALKHPLTDLSFIRDDVVTTKNPEIPSDAYLLHFAGLKSIPESFEQPDNYYTTNVGGLLNILNRYTPRGVVFSSSAAIYVGGSNVPLKEDSPVNLDLMSPYAKTKYFCEQVLREYKFPSICLRYFNPIGVHPSGLLKEVPKSGANLIPALLDADIDGKPFHLYGSGAATRDFIDINDLAESHVFAVSGVMGLNSSLEADPGTRFNNLPNFSIFNVGTGSGHTINRVIDSFQLVTGRKLTVVNDPPRIGDAAFVVADTGLFRSVFPGWSPSRTLVDSLRSLQPVFRNF